MNYKLRLILLIITFGVVSNGFAATITVINTNDNGFGSLRKAINDAGVSDIILFDASLANSTIILNTQIDILQAVTIDGGGNNISISGNSSVRCFNVSGTGTVAFYNLSIVNGSVGDKGGGIYSNSAPLDIQNCSIINCVAGDGGGINVFNGTHSFKNVRFEGNRATAFGGGFHSLFGSASFENVVFVGNKANNGGAAYLRGGTTFVNCTISGNQAVINGGAFHVFSNQNIELINSIVWNNSAAGSTSSFSAFYSIESGSSIIMEVAASVLENSGGSGAWVMAYGTDNGGNLDTDPLFNTMISPASAPTIAGNYELTTGSPCYNTGLNVQVTLATDVLQNTRILYGAVDMGAYEFCETTGNLTISECSSYTVPSGNQTYTVSGTYIDTLSNYLGCDSILTINLTINNTYGSETTTNCNTYTSPSGNYTWTSSGTYNDTIPNAIGCDSIITVTLTINNSNTGTDVQSACDTYTWIDGVAYVVSNNVATYTLTNAAGCDSVVTLNLTINYSTTGTDIQTACDNYTWIDGATYVASNNVATYTLTNAVGCDSIVTLNLTVNYSNSSIDGQTACNSFTWIDGITYTSSNNSATHTLTNIVGCDSVVTINLTILNESFHSYTETVCNSYISPSGLTWVNSGTYNDTLQNAAGCDSVITVNLTVNYESFSEIVEVACFNYTSPSGIYYDASGVYEDVIPNASGCDSIITIDLTINTVDISLVSENSTITSNATNATYIWFDCDEDYAILTGQIDQSYTTTKHGTYSVEVTQNNCIDTSDCIFINLLVTTPTAFSPNDDGVNDTFILNVENSDNIVIFFNRWGDKVMELKGYNDVDIVWDGRDSRGNLLIGTFFYTIESNGENSSGWVEVVH